MDGDSQQPEPKVRKESDVRAERRPSLTTILQAVPTFWDYLCISDAKSMKSTHRLARSQHILWCPKFRVRGAKKFKGEKVVDGLRKLASLGYRPTAIEVLCREFLTAETVLPTICEAFGTRLTSLSLRISRFEDPCDSIGLPDDPAWADRIAAGLPALRALHLQLHCRSEADVVRPLLVLRGPQLRSLSLTSLWTRWLPPWLKADVLPGLEHLALDSRGIWSDEDIPERGDGAAASAEQLAALTSLRSLELSSEDEGSLNAVPAPEMELEALSALTGLTRLVLRLPHPSNDAGDRYRFNDFSEMCNMALNCWPLAPLVSGMANLAELSVPMSYIGARDCAALAALTALTKLRCEGLATPPPEQCGEGTLAAARTRRRRRQRAAERWEQEEEEDGGGRGDDGSDSDEQDREDGRLGGLDPGAGGGGSSGGPVTEVPRVPLPPNLRELQVSDLPTLHLGACLATLARPPRLTWNEYDYEGTRYEREGQGPHMDCDTWLECKHSVKLALLGGASSRHGNALPSNKGAVQPWLAAAAAAGARYFAAALAEWEAEQDTRRQRSRGAQAGAGGSQQRASVSVERLRAFEGYSNAAVRFTRLQVLMAEGGLPGIGIHGHHRHRLRHYAWNFDGYGSMDELDSDYELDNFYSDDEADMGFDTDDELAMKAFLADRPMHRGCWMRLIHRDESRSEPVAGPHAGWLAALAPLGPALAGCGPPEDQLRLERADFDVLRQLCPQLRLRTRAGSAPGQGKKKNKKKNAAAAGTAGQKGDGAAGAQPQRDGAAPSAAAAAGPSGVRPQTAAPGKAAQPAIGAPGAKASHTAVAARGQSRQSEGDNRGPYGRSPGATAVGRSWQGSAATQWPRWQDPPLGRSGAQWGPQPGAREQWRGALPPVRMDVADGHHRGQARHWEGQGRMDGYHPPGQWQPYPHGFGGQWGGQFHGPRGQWGGQYQGPGGPWGGQPHGNSGWW